MEPFVTHGLALIAGIVLGVVGLSIWAFFENDAPVVRSTRKKKIPIPSHACSCVERIEGSWGDIGTDRTAPYVFDEKFSAKKYCEKCHGTGLRTPQ